eukprot:9224779-Pyramimonas_sp.AAC.1
MAMSSEPFLCAFKFADARPRQLSHRNAAHGRRHLVSLHSEWSPRGHRVPLTLLLMNSHVTRLAHGNDNCHQVGV